MTSKRTVGWIMISFAIITGFVIGALTWLYLKASNVGVTLVWQTIGSHFPTAVYTLIVCLIGGVIIGLFSRKYGPYPENMGDAVRRFMRERTYPYRELPIAMIAALLSLLFGGAVGPEAGLVCILLSLSVWAKDEFGMARENLDTYLKQEPKGGRARMLGRLLKEMATHPGRVAYSVGKIPWTRALQIGCGIAAALGGLFIYILFNTLFGRAFTLPHISGGSVVVKDRLAMILLFAVGIGAGYLYLVLRKLTSKVFEKLRERGLQVLNAILGGLILGLIGGRLPITMFSGGTDIQTIFSGDAALQPTLSEGATNFQAYSYEYFVAMLPFLLIIIGVLKLFLTNVCIESGWRGGHFFPLLFSGLSIGCGFAGLLGTNEILSVVVVTGALLGTVLQQPIGALVLSVIFFPLKEIGWMIAVTFVSGCIPLPAALRINPDNKGFVYNTIQRFDQRKNGIEEQSEE